MRLRFRVSPALVITCVALETAAATAPDATFVSKLYGYSLVLPGSSSGWSATFAAVMVDRADRA
jgi:hypothetical protein